MEEDTEPKEETSSEEQKPEEKPEQDTPKPEEGTEEETPKPADGTEEETPKPKDETEQEIPEPEDGIEQETPGTGTEEETEETGEIMVAEASQDLQALLAWIAALPDAEEYLATEPDADDWAENEDAYEEAYTEWMVGLYEYADEALAIQEEIEKLPEEQRAQISEEELQKLAAWAELAQTAEESAQVMATESSMVMAAEEDTSGTCGANLTWTLADGVLTISGSGAIDSYAFDGKNDIKTVVINEGVTSIGMYAFRNCSSLTSITIPASVKNIVTCAFYNCSSLTNITISEGVTSIGGNAFYSCSNLTSITIPASVTSIDSNVFHKCSNLTKVELLGELTTINSGAFWECSSLESITIPDSVESIGNFAFSGCSSLTGITIPEGVTSIGQSAFNGCSSLESITIPASVTSIGGSAFYGCSSLATVTMESEVPSTLGNSNVFYKCECTNGSTKGIHVPVGTADTYKQATNWSTYKNNITDGTHSHAWSSDWTTNETYHWHECTEQGCTVTDNAAKSGYGEHVYDSDSDTTCNTCGYTRTLQDTQPPTGKIEIDGNSWTHFQEGIIFELFFREAKQVTITAQDEGSGVDKIYYYISSEELEGKEQLNWLEWTEGNSFSIAPDRECIIYAKITDKAGNITYLSSDGLVFDATPPVISGVTDGETYHAPQTVTVKDAMFGVKSVTVNGREVTLNDNKFTLGLSDSPQIIVAEDHAGNTTTVTVTVKEQTYAVTVQNGTGAGDYKEGAIVTITANVPASGKQFDKWVVNSGNVTLTDATSSTMTFTMPAGAVSVTATYKDFVSDADKVARATTVVENALNGITATNATTEAEILGVINTALGNAGITGVTVTIDKFRKTEAIISAAGHIEGVVFITCGQESESINMEKPIAQLTAGKYTAAVNNGTGGGEYAAGDTVTIEADAPASGKQFDRWVVNSGNVTLTDATSSTTTFTMPAGAVSVSATYKDKTTTGGGSGGGDSGSGDHSGGNSGGNTGSGDYSGGSSGGNSDSSGGHSGGGSHGGGNSGNGNNNNDNGGFAGDADNNGAGGNISSDSGNGSSGAGTSGTPGVSVAGQPKVKQEKEGNIQKEVRVEGEETLDAVMETPLSKLTDIVLTEKEKQQAAVETTIRIVLDVKDASAAVSAADKALVETALNSSIAKGYTLGQYLDINLYKVIGDSRTAITQTDGKITVRIDVPESLKNTDSTKTRTFAVLRAHDGKVQLLADLDQEAGTITIETDRFSTYAIVYKDTASAAGNSDGGDGGIVQLRAESGSGKESGNGKDDEPKTGDNTPIELSATLAMIAGFGYLLLYFMDRERGMTEERKKELVSCLVTWAKQGGKIRKYMALAAIFVLLVYYHSIGKKICVEWKEVYGE